MRALVTKGARLCRSTALQEDGCALSALQDLPATEDRQKRRPRPQAVAMNRFLQHLLPAHEELLQHWMKVSSNCFVR